ncbi:MAG: DNA repair protein RecO [Phycisphaerae bacterium]|nr:DNA repair protein RecO [Phycisphaerae bacterium]
MRRRSAAICLRTGDYSETSQVAGFLTRDDGKVDLLAKGAKRAKSATGGPIDVLAEGELVYIPASREGLGTLVEFAETVARPGLRRDSRRLNAAMFMLELVGALLGEADPHVEVFDLLHNALDRLTAPQAQVGAVLAYFQWRLLRHVGLLGELARCVACGRRIAGAGRKDVHFSSIQGGLLCGACEGASTEKFRLSGAALAGLAALAAAEAGVKVTLPDKQATAVNRVLAYHAAHQIGRALKMARHAID